ncbi:CDP-archaeol synthase [Candidatus Woesearchaeota archaeon]|nr:CDP-archaeol synthase [Candidatus Woesearchaeota archaeon]
MILEAMYFFIPAFVANMMPVFTMKLRFLDWPIDNNLKFRGKRIFGDNKTWRGVFFGLLGAVVAFEIQKMLFSNGILKFAALTNYSAAPFYLGFLLGFAALLGDIAESFVKRQLKIRPGRPWVPFDQLDYIIFSVIATSPWSGITLKDALILLSIVFFVTIAVQLLGYFSKMKKDLL